MLDVTRLRVLAAVARHGSVTAAAKSLNYAQPSVSHHLARLEAETGTRLVERSGRGVKLTDAGRLRGCEVGLSPRASSRLVSLVPFRGSTTRPRFNPAVSSFFSLPRTSTD